MPWKACEHAGLTKNDICNGAVVALAYRCSHRLFLRHGMKDSNIFLRHFLEISYKLLQGGIQHLSLDIRIIQYHNFFIRKESVKAVNELL